MAPYYYMFVGETPSPTALRKGWAWDDTRLCGTTLTDALDAAGLDADRYSCRHLLTPEGDVSQEALAVIAAWQSPDCLVVSLGTTVHRALRAAGIPHRVMSHPAARGQIRQRARYHAHVAAVLGDDA